MKKLKISSIHPLTAQILFKYFEIMKCFLLNNQYRI